MFYVYIFFMFTVIAVVVVIPGLFLSFCLVRLFFILLIVERVRKIVLFSRLAKFHFLRMFYVNVYVLGERVFYTKNAIHVCVTRLVNAINRKTAACKSNDTVRFLGR